MPPLVCLPTKYLITWNLGGLQSFRAMKQQGAQSFRDDRATPSTPPLNLDISPSPPSSGVPSPQMRTPRAVDIDGDVYSQLEAYKYVCHIAGPSSALRMHPLNTVRGSLWFQTAIRRDGIASVRRCLRLEQASKHLQIQTGI